MKQRIIKVVILVVALAIILVLGYVGIRYTLAGKTKLDRPEIQWALEHPEQVKATMESYESVHKAADELFYGILEQGKE